MQEGKKVSAPRSKTPQTEAEFGEHATVKQAIVEQ